MRLVFLIKFEFNKEALEYYKLVLNILCVTYKFVTSSFTETIEAQIAKICVL